MEENISNRRTRVIRNQNEDISHMLYGKVPPQARELEEAVLGAILIEKESLGYLPDHFKAECFYVDAHASIFRAIQKLNVRSNPVDLLTVTEELRRSGELENVGGAFYLSELTNKVASSANIEYHAAIVYQKFVQRELIRISNDVIRDAYEDTTDVFELRDNAEARITELQQFTGSKGNINLFDLATRALVESDHLRKQEFEYLGIPCGLKDVDRITGGFREGDLIVIAGRPSMGKTAFGCTLAMNGAAHGHKIGYISLEMSGLQIAERMICIEKEFNLMKLRNAKYTDEEFERLKEVVEIFKDKGVFINDCVSPNLLQLKSIIRRQVQKNGVKMVIIDQLTHIKHSVPGQRSDENLGDISKMLKGVAKELGIPVILLHQINRGAEDRGGDKKPMLSDLKGSGTLEEDADIVMLLYRAEYYFKKDELKGLADIIIAKYRNGVTDEIPVAYKNWCAKFDNLNDDGFEILQEAQKRQLEIGQDINDDLPF